MNEKKPANPWTKSLLIWMAVLLGLVLFVQSIGGSRAATGEAIAYSDFVNRVDEGNVQSVTIAASPSGNADPSGSGDAHSAHVHRKGLFDFFGGYDACLAER